MVQFVKVRHVESGAIGTVPEGALAHWLERGYEQVDEATEPAAPTGQQTPPPGDQADDPKNEDGTPSTTAGAADDNNPTGTDNTGK